MCSVPPNVRETAKPFVRKHSPDSPGTAHGAFGVKHVGAEEAGNMFPQHKMNAPNVTAPGGLGHAFPRPTQLIPPNSLSAQSPQAPFGAPAGIALPRSAGPSERQAQGQPKSTLASDPVVYEEFIKAAQMPVDPNLVMILDVRATEVDDPNFPLHGPIADLKLVVADAKTLQPATPIALDRLNSKAAQAVRSDPVARQVYQSGVRAAEQAAGTPDTTAGAIHFILDHGQRMPDWVSRMETVSTYGPFVNQAGGGDLPRGASVRIRILRRRRR